MTEQKNNEPVRVTCNLIGMRNDLGRDKTLRTNHTARREQLLQILSSAAFSGS